MYPGLYLVVKDGSENKGQKENVRDLLNFRYHPRQIERDSQANRLRHESEMLRSSGYKKV
jgi:hypothetical protein